MKALLRLLAFALIVFAGYAAFSSETSNSANGAPQLPCPKPVPW